MNNIVETVNLTKIYGKKTRAVDDLNLQIKEGEIFGLLGPNGAGKSTTIRMLTTLTQPTSGRALVAGYDVISEPEKVRQEIGYSAQESGVDENATGREYLELYGHYYHLDKKTLVARTNELFNLVGLTDVAINLVKTYSGGMRKRLEIATALIHKPKLLFLDEPTLGLDIQTRSHIWEYIRKLNKGGVTVLLTTHYLEEADKLCDRIAIIDHGIIVALDTPKELKSKIKGQVVTVALTIPENERLDAVILKAQQALTNQPFITSMQTTDDRLVIRVIEGSSDLVRIQVLLEKANVAIDNITLTNPSLDDVFIVYTGQAMREEKGKATSLYKMGAVKGRR